MQVNLTRIDLVVVGAASAEYAALLGDYEQRLGRYARLAVHEVKGEPLQRGEAQVLAAEQTRLAKVLDQVAGAGAAGAASGAATIVTCDRGGEQLATEQLAERWLDAQHLVLVIGGAFGLPEDVRRRAAWSVAFGKATMPHQLARLVATEQLYRCFRVARGEPYHY